MSWWIYGGGIIMGDEFQIDIKDPVCVFLKCH